PRCMTHPDTLRNKYHSSILLTVSSQEEIDMLLRHQGNIFLYGRYTSFSRYQDLKPLKQCNNCWSYSHHTSQCDLPAKCKICAGPHADTQHVCTE
ncbi:hypothetical protein BV22DRAFT_990276, partial [Leucogyrophana mollusca]